MLLDPASTTAKGGSGAGSTHPLWGWGVFVLVGNSSPTPCTCSLRRGVCLWRTPKQVGWGLQEKRRPHLRVPKALGRINGDRSGCRQERGAVIRILVEAGEMLLGSLRQAVKYGGAGHRLMESCGDSKVVGGGFADQHGQRLLVVSAAGRNVQAERFRGPGRLFLVILG